MSARYQQEPFALSLSKGCPSLSMTAEKKGRASTSSARTDGLAVSVYSND